MRRSCAPRWHSTVTKHVMPAPATVPSLRLAFYGDDFTGSTDTLATLAERRRLRSACFSAFHGEGWLRRPSMPRHRGRRTLDARRTECAQSSSQLDSFRIVARAGLPLQDLLDFRQRAARRQHRRCRRGTARIHSQSVRPDRRRAAEPRPLLRVRQPLRGHRVRRACRSDRSPSDDEQASRHADARSGPAPASPGARIGACRQHRLPDVRPAGRCAGRGHRSDRGRRRPRCAVRRRTCRASRGPVASCGNALDHRSSPWVRAVSRSAARAWARSGPAGPCAAKLGKCGARLGPAFVLAGSLSPVTLARSGCIVLPARTTGCGSGAGERYGLRRAWIDRVGTHCATVAASSCTASGRECGRRSGRRCRSPRGGLRFAARAVAANRVART